MSLAFHVSLRIPNNFSIFCCWVSCCLSSANGHRHHVPSTVAGCGSQSAAGCQLLERVLNPWSTHTPSNTHTHTHTHTERERHTLRDKHLIRFSCVFLDVSISASEYFIWVPKDDTGFNNFIRLQHKQSHTHTLTHPHTHTHSWLLWPTLILRFVFGSC